MVPKGKSEFEESSWIEFACSDSSMSLEKLNAKLEEKMYLVGGSEPTLSDFVVLWQSRKDFEKLEEKDQRGKFSALTRWFDGVQSHPRVRSFKGEELSGAKAWVPVVIGHHNLRDVLNEKASAEMLKKALSGSIPIVAKKKSSDNKDKKNQKQQQQQQKKKQKKEKKQKAQPAAEAQSYFDKGDIRVGYVTKAWKHPEADKLFCEEIDVGEDKVRQIASGLWGKVKQTDFEKSKVLVVCNLPAKKTPGDFVSYGMVLCAQSPDGSSVELIRPPENAKIGERVFIEGMKVDDCPPKDAKWMNKNLRKKFVVYFSVSKDGKVCYQGKPWMTSAGPVTASTLKGEGIKVS